MTEKDTDQLTELVRKRSNLKAHLTRFETFLKTYSSEKEPELRLRLDKATPILDEVSKLSYRSEKEPELRLRLDKATPILDDYNLLQDSIEAIDDRQSNDREEFENKYFNIISIGNKIITESQIKTISNKTETNVSIESSTNNPMNLNVKLPKITLPETNNPMNLNVKLPKITLPEFDGSYDKWLMFSDAFKSLIAENQQLNLTQKFYYLRSCLKGEAEQVINALEASDSNYTVAWDLLRDRYENKRIIIHSHE
ncbi:Protein of unknown function (DUF1759) [Popillia japonica]|uniref:Uncharacterized protein n=1 Tax=Popillia japonica TaxID=7064 RepID=A0AAW1LY97_POPJA